MSLTSSHHHINSHLPVQSNYTRSLMLGLSFDSTIAFSIGISRIASLEAETTGLTYGSLFLSIKGYSVFESMLFMVLDGHPEGVRLVAAVVLLVHEAVLEGRDDPEEEEGGDPQGRRQVSLAGNVHE